MSNKSEFILRRIIISLITILFLIVVTFVLMHMLPGEPYSGQRMLPDEVKEAMRVNMVLINQ